MPALVTAVTCAPRRFASWIAAAPTPPEAPVISTRSAPTSARCNMPSAVEKAQGNDASSSSVRVESIAIASVDAAVVYSANAPSRSDPKVIVVAAPSGPAMD